MPVHDWTLVEAGIVHDFQIAWLPSIQKGLNAGVLPTGYYALVEQHSGRSISDFTSIEKRTIPSLTVFAPRDSGGIAVAEAPPRVRRKQTLNGSFLTLQRSLAIRHVNWHELIALIEVLSPANKDRVKHVEEFTAKVESALDAGVHVLVIDLFPPGPHDRQGIHGAMHQMLELSSEKYDLPADEPLTLASYVAGARIDVYLEHMGIGASLPEMPLFLSSKRYVNVPLESTYQSAYEGMPSFWRAVLEEKKSELLKLPYSSEQPTKSRQDNRPQFGSYEASEMADVCSCDNHAGVANGDGLGCENDVCVEGTGARSRQTCLTDQCPIVGGKPHGLGRKRKILQVGYEAVQCT